MSDSRQIEAVRQHSVIRDMMCFRLACHLQGDGDEAIFRRHYGPEGSFSFWENYLTGVVNLPLFVHYLSLARAEGIEQIDSIRMALQHALLEAYQDDAPIFRGDLSEIASVSYYRDIRQPKLIKLKGQQAAEWLLNTPKWCNLLPSTLAAFLHGEKPKVTGSPKRKPRGTGETEFLNWLKSSPVGRTQLDTDTWATQNKVSRATARRWLKEYSGRARGRPPKSPV